MPRKEVLVQLDDDLVSDLDRIAAARGVSRSALLRWIAAAFVQADDERLADAQLIASYRAHPQEERELAAWMSIQVWPEP